MRELINIVSIFCAIFFTILSIACSNRIETELYMNNPSQQNLNTSQQQCVIRQTQSNNSIRKKYAFCCFYNWADALFCYFCPLCLCCARICCDGEGTAYRNGINSFPN